MLFFRLFFALWNIYHGTHIKRTSSFFILRPDKVEVTMLYIRNLSEQFVMIVPIEKYDRIVNILGQARI